MDLGSVGADSEPIDGEDCQKQRQEGYANSHVGIGVIGYRVNRSILMSKQLKGQRSRLIPE